LEKPEITAQKATDLGVLFVDRAVGLAGRVDINVDSIKKHGLKGGKKGSQIRIGEKAGRNTGVPRIE